MKPLEQCLLYAFVDSAYLKGRSPETIARQLCDGGADLVQLRAKNSPPDEIKRLAERILPIVDAAQAGLVINDHPQIAAEVGAPFCHLGQEDFFEAGYSHTRELLAALPKGAPGSATLRLGLSTHAPAQAERALAAAPGYLAIGPVFKTPTKPSAPAVTLEYVRWAAREVALPWFAIGGITLENLEEVLAAGARRIALVSAILNAAHPAQACQRFKDRLLSADRDRTH